VEFRRERGGGWKGGRGWDGFEGELEGRGGRAEEEKRDKRDDRKANSVRLSTEWYEKKEGMKHTFTITRDFFPNIDSR